MAQGKCAAQACPVAGKVSQSQGFLAIRLFDLSKLGKSRAWW
jgi:hypothetical protein